MIDVTLLFIFIVPFLSATSSETTNSKSENGKWWSQADASGSSRNYLLQQLVVQSEGEMYV